mgnify:FL=1
MQVQFPLILDGATGTELQKRGFTGTVSAEEWVLAHPESILDIQRRYVDAGSRVLYAPSFGANRQKLEEHGIFNQTAAYNRRLAALSKQAAAGRALVAGDLSPTGLFLSPMGETSFRELVDIYTPQAAGLEKAGVDLFVIETMMTLSDARAAVLAVRSVSDKPIFVTFTCDEKGRTVSGTDITAALVIMQGMGVDAFGLNCSAGPQEMLVQLRRLQEYARVPLIAKPNAGMPQIVDGKAVYSCPPEEFTALVPELLQAGVAIFGGCCGTDAGHIAALKKALDGAEITPPSPRHPTLLPAATEKLPMYLPADAKHGPVIAVTENLEDDLQEAMDGDEPMVAVALQSTADAEELAQMQYLIEKPLCLVCDDGAVLEAALRSYQGRALYEGALPEETLARLQELYGLIY